MSARAIAAGLLLAAATLAGGAVAVPAASAASASAGHGLVVATDRGLIKGTYAEGTDQFLGVPYAAPPAGALRWAAPRPAPRWAGIRQATSYGSRCAQLASGTARGSTTRIASTSTCTRRPASTAAPPAMAAVSGGCPCWS